MHRMFRQKFDLAQVFFLYRVIPIVLVIFEFHESQPSKAQTILVVL